MSEVDSQPNLRLVGCDDWPIAAASSAARGAPVRLAAESWDANHKPPLEPTDPRWILAARAYSQLEDQTLTYQHRDRLLRMGRQLGVRPLDVNMIIAIVQDHARRGIDLSEAVEAIAAQAAGCGPLGRMDLGSMGSGHCDGLGRQRLAHLVADRMIPESSRHPHQDSFAVDLQH